jgi:Tfp pilus assembly protein PilF
MKPADNLLARAFALHQQGQIKKAERLYAEVLKSDPHQFDALHLLGLVKHQQDNHVEALRLIGAALKIKPNYADALLNYGSVLGALKRHEESLVYFDRALALGPLSARTLNNRGNALVELRRFDEALACFDRALSIDPNYANCLVNRAHMLVDLGRYAEAMPSYQRALNLRPDDAGSQTHMAFAELATGNFASGWKRYEWRWKRPETPAPRHSLLPRWNGENVNGAIVAWGEQGVGDEVLFASMVPDLAARVGSVVLEVDPRLKKLLARSFPQVQVIARGEPLPADVTVQAPLATLGQFLRPNWDSFTRPDSGYVVADADRTAELRRRLSPNREPVIGLSWVSKHPEFAEFKTAQLGDFQSVLHLPECRFVDLQYGDTLAEREAVRQSFGVVVQRLEDIDNMNDIDGLASLITACDVVVTVSNTTAHLAGALGKPTVLLVPHTGRPWCWFSGRDDSPWYPRMYVKRQQMGQSWKDLVSLAAGQVADLVKVAQAGHLG